MVNGTATALSCVPECGMTDLVEATAKELDRGARLCAWFGVAEGPKTRVVAVLAYDADGVLGVAWSSPFRGAYPCLTVLHPQAHLFERELWEQFGVEPAGHPWLKSVRRMGPGAPLQGTFFQVEGAEVHEVGVGPVHAGIIEPGHFRFQCFGEEVLHLEIALGYQYRGVEEAQVGGPHGRTLWQMETVAGDTTVGHATAYAMVREALSGVEAPLRAQWLRAVALELERLANHTGDLGALAGDVAFLPTAAACGRLRGEFLNLTALICGNRFGRGLVRPGGCRWDLEPERSAALRKKLAGVLEEVAEVVGWLWEANSVRARFQGTGRLELTQARALGLVGVAARASGLVRDVRFDHPAGWYRFAQLPVAVWPDGDVYGRAKIRDLEIQRSGALLLQQLEAGPEGELKTEVGSPGPDAVAVALVEGWRGEICHVAVTGPDGRFRRYKIVDPSFHNWTGLAMAMRGQAISDFPLCNKSFNLSYCGFDL
ncbi:MAG: NADH-quinone oxidoreductase subunit C [Limisphaera sp.]